MTSGKRWRLMIVRLCSTATRRASISSRSSSAHNRQRLIELERLAVQGDVHSGVGLAKAALGRFVALTASAGPCQTRAAV